MKKTENVIPFPTPEVESAFLQEFAQEATEDLLDLVRKISAFHDEALERGDIDGSEPKRRFIERTLALLLRPMLNNLEQRGLL